MVLPKFFKHTSHLKRLWTYTIFSYLESFFERRESFSGSLELIVKDANIQMTVSTGYMSIPEFLSSDI